MKHILHCLTIISFHAVIAGCNPDASNVEQSGQIIKARQIKNVVTKKLPLPAKRHTKITAKEAYAIKEIQKYMSPIEGSWSVAIKEIGSDIIMKAGLDKPMAQQSVSKLWVAMAVMDRIERGELKATDIVTISQKDRAIFHQPLAQRVADGPAKITIGELLLISITKSDNMANQVLLELAGGPEFVREIMRKNNINIGFGPGDRNMQSAISGLNWHPSFSNRRIFEKARQKVPSQLRTKNYRAYAQNPVDGATAEEMVLALEKMANGNTPGGKTILQAMKITTTGRSRLKSGAPKDWMLMHKTGTGQNWKGRTAGFNDVGVLTAPDGRRFAVAVLIGDSSSSQKTMQNAIKNIAVLTVRYHSLTRSKAQTQIKGFQAQ